MAYFLRVIRQTRWFGEDEVDWLGPGEVPGDALRDLVTVEGVLSIYRVDDEPAKWRVITALAASRDDVDVLDYSRFDGSDLGLYAITANPVTGRTPDVRVDGWHYDLVNLTANKVALLAGVVAHGEMDRVQKPKVKSLVRKGLADGQLDQTKIKAKLLKSLA